jgi:alginate O-acetyltransferase complex protein AlgJ
MPATIDPLSLPPLPPVPQPAPATHPMRDRIVATLFALALAVPLLALSFTWSRTTTQFEKRPMAPWPTLELSTSFPQAFEQAFADRFGGRDLLIRAHHASLLEFFGVSALATVMPGHGGWYYWLGEDGHSLDRHYRGVADFPKSYVDATAAELIRRNDWLTARGTAYVVAIVPEKFTIYPEFLPGWVAKSTRPSPYDSVVAALQGSRVALIDLRPALRTAKTRDRVYYQTDSHWNYNGALIGYDAIMREAQRQLPANRMSKIVPAQRPAYNPGIDFYSGDLIGMLGLPGRIREDDVAPLGKILADTTSRCAKRIDPPSAPDIETYVCDRPDLPRAVVYRDSMAIPLIPMLAENFSRVIFVTGRNLDPALIEREKPDIVIEEMVERALHGPGAQPMKIPGQN